MRNDTTKKIVGFLAATVLGLSMILPLATHAGGEPKFEQIKPKIELEIPTVKLSDIKSDKGSVGIPWLAQYLTGVYAYAAAIASLLAAVMLIIAGLRWSTAGGNAQAVSKAQKGITAALAGLFLIFGANALLRTIDENTVNLKAIEIETVEAERMELMKIGFADQQTFEGNLSVIPGTAVPEVPPDGRPPIESEKMPISESLDLYKEGNKFNHVVKGRTPRERVNSVCTSVIGKGSGDQDIIERAAAITRVWIIETVLRNGGIYVRCQGVNGMCSPQWNYAKNISTRGGKSLCIQEFGNERLGNDSDITVAAIIEGCAQVEAGRVRDPQLSKACRYGSPVYNLLRDGYRQCWCIPAWQAGLVGYDCTNYVVALTQCAMGVGSPRTAPLQADAIYALDQKKEYYGQFRNQFGFQPFDLYHAGAKGPTGNDLVHSFMYIGGLGLTYEGKGLYWIEMGGGGAADYSSGEAVATGIAGRPKLNGASSIGVTAHYQNKDYAATGWPGTDPKPMYSYVYRMLKRAQNSYQEICGGKPCLYMSDEDKEKIDGALAPSP